MTIVHRPPTAAGVSTLPLVIPEKGKWLIEEALPHAKGSVYAHFSTTANGPPLHSSLLVQVHQVPNGNWRVAFYAQDMRAHLLAHRVVYLHVVCKNVASKVIAYHRTP